VLSHLNSLYKHEIHYTYFGGDSNKNIISHRNIILNISNNGVIHDYIYSSDDNMPIYIS